MTSSSPCCRLRPNLYKYTEMLSQRTSNRILIGVLLILVMPPSVADVIMRALSGASPTKEYISIEGKISTGDDERLIALLPRWQGDISLNTGGGDVEASMALGRTLRKVNRAVVVLPKSTCASACVFVLAGAPTRIVFGSVAIHRPFLPNDTLTNPDGQKLRYKVIEYKIKEYLSEMNVHPGLYDDMLRVSSTQARFLSKSELERYGLSGSDPFVDEAQVSENANNLRISKAEYIARMQRIEVQCAPLMQRDPLDYGKCAVAVEYGISRAEYNRRSRVAESECLQEPDRAAWSRCKTRITRGF